MSQEKSQTMITQNFGSKRGVLWICASRELSENCARSGYFHLTKIAFVLKIADSLQLALVLSRKLPSLSEVLFVIVLQMADKRLLLFLES